MLARAFPYEHSIFLFYVQRYTQKPDLAVYRDPHRGANGIVIEEDIVADLVDVAAIVDIGGTTLSVAGRPQPPPAGAIAGFICTLCIAICCSPTLPGTIRAKVFIYFRYAQKKHFVSSVITRRSTVRWVLVC